MNTHGRLFVVVALCLLAWAGSATARDTKIGVVDLGRLISDSPQAQRAKSNMANQFAERKNQIESKTGALRQDMDRLARDGSVMSEDAREKLQSSIRDRQRELQLQQSKYNDDVADAEQQEFDSMRADIRAVIDQYADDKGYDIILGDSVLYATDALDVTDEVLERLKKRE